MNVKHLALSLVAGVSTFGLVVTAVTAITQQWIEFSVLLGIPAGIVTGVLATGGVYLGLGADDSPARRRIARSSVVFAVVFLGALSATAGLLQSPLMISVGVGLTVGSIAAIAHYLRRSNLRVAAQA